MVLFTRFFASTTGRRNSFARSAVVLGRGGAHVPCALELSELRAGRDR